MTPPPTISTESTAANGHLHGQLAHQQAARAEFARSLRSQLPSPKEGIVGTLATIFASYLIFRMEVPKQPDPVQDRAASVAVASELNQLTASVQAMGGNFREVSEDLHDLKQSNQLLKEAIQGFALKLVDLEQRTRANEREIDRLRPRGQ